MAQPGNPLVFAVVGDELAVFIFPVRGDAFFRDAMHFGRPDLHFKGLTACDDRSVQGLVTVRPRHRDEVFDAARDRRQVL